MEFIHSIYDPSKPGHFVNHYLLKDIDTEEEVIDKVRQEALRMPEGWVVGLFSRELKALAGWKVLKNNKLQDKPLDGLSDFFQIDRITYELIKMQDDGMRRSGNKNSRLM